MTSRDRFRPQALPLLVIRRPIVSELLPPSVPAPRSMVDPPYANAGR